MQPLLAIETSGSSLGIALRTEQGLAFERDVTAGAIHGRALAPLVDECLRARRLKVEDLRAVAASIGPGSWTGLRIGLTAAKTLAWAAKIGLVAVPSFEALAWQAARRLESPAPILALRNARSEGFFAAIFPETCAASQRWLPECVLPREQLLREVDAVLRKHGASGLAVCGDGVCIDALAAAAGERGWRLLREEEHIQGKALAEVAWRHLQAGRVLRTPEEIHRAAPLYLRASDPELKLKSRAARPD